jgi:hypothetical protein
MIREEPAICRTDSRKSLGEFRFNSRLISEGGVHRCQASRQSAAGRRPHDSRSLSREWLAHGLTRWTVRICRKGMAPCMTHVPHRRIISMASIFTVWEGAKWPFRPFSPTPLAGVPHAANVHMERLVQYNEPQQPCDLSRLAPSPAARWDEWMRRQSSCLTDSYRTHGRKCSVACMGLMRTWPPVTHGGPWE